MSRSILDDNYDHAKKLVTWLDVAVEAANEWRAGGLDAAERRYDTWERIQMIANQLADHAKHAAEVEALESGLT